MTSKHRIALVIVVATALGPAAAFAQENRGTAQQRAACMPDAFRLCSGYIPDAAGVEHCLRQNMTDLSAACRSVFEQGAVTQVSRSK